MIKLTNGHCFEYMVASGANTLAWINVTSNGPVVIKGVVGYTERYIYDNGLIFSTTGLVTCPTGDTPPMAWANWHGPAREPLCCNRPGPRTWRAWRKGAVAWLKSALSPGARTDWRASGMGMCSERGRSEEPAPAAQAALNL